MMFGTTNLRIDVFVCVAGGEKCIMEVNLKGGLRVVVWSVWGIGTITQGATRTLCTTFASYVRTHCTHFLEVPLYLYQPPRTLLRLRRVQYTMKYTAVLYTTMHYTLLERTAGISKQESQSGGGHTNTVTINMKHEGYPNKLLYSK